MPELRIVLEGTQRSVQFCPVSAVVNRSLRELQDCALIDVAREAAVPFQAVGEAGGAALHWIVDSLAAGQRKEYVLRPSAQPSAPPGVKVKPEGDDRVRVAVGGELLTRYLHGPQAAHPCLYPLRGPFGGGVTRAYPHEEVEGDSTDHVHHRSLWVAWGDVNGSDNWSEEEGHGRVVHRYFDACEGGPVFGRIVALNDWEDAAGNRYKVVGKYAIAPVNGTRMIEVQYFRDPVGSMGGLGPFDKIKDDDLKGDYEFVLLFLVEPGAEIVSFSSGGSASRRDDLRGEGLVAPE